MLAACTYPDYDGYTLHVTVDSQAVVESDNDTISTIRQHAARAASASSPS
jgi:hypothetical protein